ncbi:hydroxymethylbilane synthase [Mitsuokella sp.]|uniref:hydroxymethylbilane synthase n=1 Tax=Mitsuokella TaxID=52225 RepID=UPI0029E2B39B|nr:hydroxymethylbilane synthase [Mitsuokella sp.]MDD6382290.1 hydroxymethylbilane synthase [Selenomonadaceae bacterium]MDY4474745.1 hydroxymethylbilane synthase [Mitsuokella sp.]
MKNDTIIIGTRSSKLALWQADYVADCLQKTYPSLHVEKRLMTTKGDKILDAPLAKIGGKGLFTKELEQDMLAGGIDIAVHSLKDMPTEVPEGLVISAITKRFDPGDAVVSPRYKTLRDLPQGAKVGTSSLRRKAQLLHVRPDLHIEDLRGNVNTRLRKLEEDHFDAIILAVAGLKRLGFGDRITEVLPQELVLPAVGQGALAIETRCDDQEVRQLIDFLNDEKTVCCAEAERAFLARVEGGCQVPVGVYATPLGEDRLRVQAVIASLDGSRLYRDEMSGSTAEATVLGRELADRLLAAGGLAIMHELGLLLDRS